MKLCNGYSYILIKNDLPWIIGLPRYNDNTLYKEI